LTVVQEKFDERMKGLNSRLEGLDGEQVKEEEEALDIAKRRLQVPPLPTRLHHNSMNHPIGGEDRKS